MVDQKLKKIFLSASIPIESRDKIYYENADIISIRDSIRAITSIIYPNYHLVWGGHPSITPLIRTILEKLGVNIQNHVTLYQSEYFKNNFPDDNVFFENLYLTPAGETQEISINIMRKAMLTDNNFVAGIFIGGMEGILDEYELFKKFNQEAIVLPVASTGGASSFLYDKIFEPDIRLKTDTAYVSLFKDLLKNI